MVLIMIIYPASRCHWQTAQAYTRASSVDFSLHIDIERISAFPVSILCLLHTMPCTHHAPAITQGVVLCRKGNKKLHFEWTLSHIVVRTSALLGLCICMCRHTEMSYLTIHNTYH